MLVMLGSNLSKVMATTLKVKLEKRSEDDDVEKSTTKDDQQDVRAARKACKNTLEFVTSMLMRRDFWRLIIIIVSVCLCQAEEHSQQNVSNRSPEESFIYWHTAAEGQGLDDLNKILDNLTSLDLMFKLDFHLGEDSLHDLGDLDLDNPFVNDEDSLAGKIGDLSLAMCRFVGRTKAALSHYPYKFTLLGKAETEEAGMEQFKQDYDDYIYLKTLFGPFWKKVLERHYFSTVHGQQMVLLAIQQKWAPGGVLALIVKNQWSGLTQSKIVEDGWREERVEEHKPSSFKKQIQESEHGPR